MSLNLKLTQKLLNYFYTVKKIGNKLVFTNVLNSDVYTIPCPKSFIEKKDKLFLIDDKSFLNKYDCKKISKNLKLQSWLYDRLGQTDYQEFYVKSPKTLYQIYNSNGLKEVESELEHLKDKISNLFKQYSKLKEPQFKTIRFRFISKEKGSINCLNSIIPYGTLLRKQSEFHLIVHTTRYVKVLEKVKQIFETYLLNNANSYYSFHEKF